MILRCRFISFPISAILIAWLLAGCSAMSSYESLPLQPPDRFSTEGGEHSVSTRWWHDFSDPSLDQLIEQALADNFSLRAAWGHLRQSEAVAQREGAARLPSLELKGSVSRQDSNASEGETSRQFGFHAA